jgi:uncharacterized protein YkwD
MCYNYINDMRKIVIILFLVVLVLPLNQAAAATPLASRLSGRILLAVEQTGEAWYVNPKNLERYSLSDPFKVIKATATGISNANLEKIPLFNSTAKITNQAQLNFINSVKGRIFLQVEDRGQAWYVNPANGKRYYLITTEGITAVIKKIGLGISNANLAQITIAPAAASQTVKNNITTTTPFDLNYLEQRINGLVNAERASNGLPALIWNGDIAAVARQHSQDLAQENELLTGNNKGCDYFMIHHEGFDFGIYQDSRLNNRGINYFSSSGENIAMQGGKNIVFSSASSVADQNMINQCQDQVDLANNSLKATLESNISEQEKTNLILSELSQRRLEFAAEKTINVISISYDRNDEIASSTVLGWMNSPGHRANILRPEYNESGIGVAYVNGYIIATQDFITRVSCGFKGAPCCPSRSCYVPNTCQVNNLCQ